MMGFTQDTAEKKLRMLVRKRRWRRWCTHVRCQCCGRVSLHRGLCREHLREWRYLTQRAVLLAAIEGHLCLTDSTLLGQVMAPA